MIEGDGVADGRFVCLCGGLEGAQNSETSTNSIVRRVESRL